MFRFNSCLLTLLVVIARSLAQEEPIVTIKWGKIKGLTKTVDGTKVNIFYGIPYAQSTSGDERFRRPKPIEGRYEGEVFNADSNEKVCHSMMVGPIVIPPVYKVIETEDCLNLNIWSPGDLSGDTLKPVLVFIHGGALLVDGSRDPRMSDGTMLAARGDMVVVTMRYRLGVFGCFFGDSDDAPGNLPLEDQALALEWIQDNIKYFGGDPTRVTLSGESAGSISASLHFLRPSGKPLFNQLILQSGAVLTGLNEDVPSAKQRAVNIAQKLGCLKSNEEKLNAEALACVKSVTPEALMEAYLDPSTYPESYFTTPLCLVDKGDFSQVGADQRLIAGDFPQNIPTLVTTMEDEGSIIRGFLKQKPGQSYQEMLTQVFGSLHTPGKAQDLVRTYFDGIMKQDEFETEKTFLRFLGDRYFKCPSIWFAEKIMERNPVYTLEYTYASPVLSKMEPELLFGSKFGPRHASDLLFVFGSLLPVKAQVVPEDIELTEEIISIWTQFVHTGKVPWAGYEKTAETGIVLPHQYETNPTRKSNSTRFDPRYIYCQVWKKVIYDDTF